MGVGGHRVRPVQGGGGPQGGACYVFKSCLSAGCSCLASPRDSGDSLPVDTMTIDGPVALFKSSTNCSRAPFSAPGPYCWSSPLKARPGPEPPEAPARVQPCASPAAGSRSGSLGAAGDPAAHSGAPRRPGYRHQRLSHKEAESARPGACAGPGGGGGPRESSTLDPRLRETTPA